MVPPNQLEKKSPTRLVLYAVWLFSHVWGKKGKIKQLGSTNPELRDGRARDVANH